MWIVTDCGFFSVVRKPEDVASGQLTVRARVRAHLDALRQRHLPELGPTQDGGGTDYPFRAKIGKAHFAKAMARIGEAIDYDNVKTAIRKRQGHELAHALGEVWEILRQLDPMGQPPQTSSPPPQPKKSTPTNKSTSTSKPKASSLVAPLAKGAPAPQLPAPERSYGGVVFDEAGRVLLVKPSKRFGGYVWTFPKGEPKAGETDQDAALREVLEETGHRAQIVGRLDHEFAGSTKVKSIYFVMQVVDGPVAATDAESEAVAWSTPEEAKARLAMTQHAEGRARDAKVLQAALAWRASPR